MLSVNDQAPTFVAASTQGELDLAVLLKEGPAVLYFYPRAMTSG
jgi:peroxiredoxin